MPGDAGYGVARQLWDRRFDGLRPRAVAYCASVEDVVRVVDWARSRGIHLVPRSGGHSYGGYSSGNGVVVADVSRLKQVSVAAGTATIGAGAKLGHVYAALAAHGVTIPAGSCPTVGLAGLALGGGVGYASRQLGTTADNVRHVSLVTADGRPRSCDATHEPDLFWALRGGGGGNFGIATGFTLATHPVSTVSIYEIEWPWAQAAQAVAAWQAFAPGAPDALFSVLDLIATGQAGARAHVVSAGQFFGSESELSKMLQPLASTGTPITVKTNTLSYLDAILHWADCREGTVCTEPRATLKAKSDYIAQPLPAAAIAALVNAITTRQKTGGRGAIYFDASGGAINRVAKDTTAFVHRDQLFSLQYTTQWTGAGAAEPRMDRPPLRTTPTVRLRLRIPELHRPRAADLEARLLRDKPDAAQDRETALRPAPILPLRPKPLTRLPPTIKPSASPSFVGQPGQTRRAGDGAQAGPGSAAAWPWPARSLT